MLAHEAPVPSGNLPARINAVAQTLPEKVVQRPSVANAPQASIRAAATNHTKTAISAKGGIIKTSKARKAANHARRDSMVICLNQQQSPTVNRVRTAHIKTALPALTQSPAAFAQLGTTGQLVPAAARRVERGSSRLPTGRPRTRATCVLRGSGAVPQGRPIQTLASLVMRGRSRR